MSSDSKKTLLNQAKFVYHAEIFAVMGAPGVLGSLGEGLFIFRELGSTANYFRGAGEQAHSLGD